jgi:hypothetical protein
MPASKKPKTLRVHITAIESFNDETQLCTEPEQRSHYPRRFKLTRGPSEEGLLTSWAVGHRDLYDLTFDAEGVLIDANPVTPENP